MPISRLPLVVLRTGMSRKSQRAIASPTLFEASIQSKPHSGRSQALQGTTALHRKVPNSVNEAFDELKAELLISNADNLALASLQRKEDEKGTAIFPVSDHPGCDRPPRKKLAPIPQITQLDIDILATAMTW